ncbi:MAG: beta-lactamase family protein [Verrucomicrobia subdivision 3 bacterium]|nr:beta-lactamase family protein [Limisphaerales bacterium]
MIPPLLSSVILFLAASTALADKIDDYVEGQMRRRRIPGLVLAVVRNEKTTKTEAYGLANVELQVSARKEAVFEIGSVTKQFTATLILMLTEEGKISLDDQITRFFTNAPLTWKEITVRHLLTHTSGIKNYNSLSGFEAARRLNGNKFVALMASHPLEAPPGQTYSYCNTGYNLLGYILESVTGKSYWTFLQERILEPLQMHHTASRDLKTVITNRADGYEIEKSVLVNRDSDLTDVFSAGAIVSTIPDLLKWNAALDTERFLSKASRETMWTQVTLNSGERRPYGFGWRLDEHKGRRVIWHSGSTAGFTACLLRFPEERLAVIVLCNLGEQGTATHVAKGIADLFPPSSVVKSERP